MLLSATIRNDRGEALGMVVLNEKTFASGRTGWHGQGKLEIGGDRYQVQAQLVKIGEPESKPDDVGYGKVEHHLPGREDPLRV